MHLVEMLVVWGRDLKRETDVGVVGMWMLFPVVRLDENSLVTRVAGKMGVEIWGTQETKE